MCNQKLYCMMLFIIVLTEKLWICALWCVHYVAMNFIYLVNLNKKSMLNISLTTTVFYNQQKCVFAKQFCGGLPQRHVQKLGNLIVVTRYEYVFK